MSNSLAKHPDVRKMIPDLETRDENTFDTLSSKSWDGDAIECWTEKAVCIAVRYAGLRRDIWFPYSHLRIDHQGTLYFANWLLRRQGIA